jgi:hypothetical protein
MNIYDRIYELVLERRLRSRQSRLATHQPRVKYPKKYASAEEQREGEHQERMAELTPQQRREIEQQRSRADAAGVSPGRAGAEAQEQSGLATDANPPTEKPRVKPLPGRGTGRVGSSRARRAVRGRTSR